ncbi:MAG: tetratricopeptide repeat protein [Candidatus Marinimicrobia bacterium]|nr:tetratricopeptide repeat protein [Candidatus Neomarinimicrobiota bacterium]MCF7827815.1 tetratricopeptide repeat protein [Candidatus Neomarinimicrobiota bacterium]MCF7879430.1 tetratricopeptide repeat protein [Candidatus Neomarinimicrobiota bacterium]
MRNKLSVLLLLGCIFPAITGFAQESGLAAPETESATVSPDSAAVENKFRMYDLGIQVEPTEAEKDSAARQLEQMANKSARNIAQQEQARARARIDSIMQADEAALDSAAQAADTTIQQAQPTLAGGQSSDSLITLAELQERMNALRVKYQEQIADLRDQNLQLTRKIEYLEQEFQRTQQANVSKQEEKSSTPASLRPDEPKPPKTPPAQPHLERQYLLGVRQYYGSNFAEALKKFRQVVDQSEDRELAATAQYWMGECYYQLGNFSQAIQEMDQYINAFKATKHRIDALVITGLSQKRLGQLEQALGTFERVVQNYPDSEYARIARSEVRRLRYVTS